MSQASRECFHSSLEQAKEGPGITHSLRIASCGIMRLLECLEGLSTKVVQSLETNSVSPLTNILCSHSNEVVEACSTSSTAVHEVTLIGSLYCRFGEHRYRYHEKCERSYKRSSSYGYFQAGIEGVFLSPFSPSLLPSF